MKKNFLKIITSRNPFSKEYGTWIIVFSSLVFPLVYMKEVNMSNVLFILTVFFGMIFRYELLDFLNKKQHLNLKKPHVNFWISLVFAPMFFFLFIYRINKLEYLILIPFSFSALLLNIFTRRKEGKRQSIFV